MANKTLKTAKMELEEEEEGNEGRRDRGRLSTDADDGQQQRPALQDVDCRVPTDLAKDLAFSVLRGGDLCEGKRAENPSLNPPQLPFSLITQTPLQFRHLLLPKVGGGQGGVGRATAGLGPLAPGATHL